MKLELVHFNHQDNNNLTSWPDMRTSSWKPNYGDMLVCAAIVRQLEFTLAGRVAFGGESRSHPDRAIIRGSTYLHNRFDFDAANKTLDSLDVPMAIIGLGAQNPVQELTFLDGNAGARDFIARLNERSESISVRGQFTADIVERLGGRNVRITGCPSLFYSLSAPRIAVPELLSHPQRRLGVSIHSGLMRNIFCHAPEEARARHTDAIAWCLANGSNVSLFEQGVPLEYDIAADDLSFAERKSAAQSVLERIDAGDRVSALDLMARMVSVKSIEEWLAKARDTDAIIGFRFHGNMVALLQGKPCFYYTYDSRLKEFCDLYNLPHRDVTAPFEDPVACMMDHDWDDTNARISRLLGEVGAFYRENGFSTVLPG